MLSKTFFKTSQIFLILTLFLLPFFCWPFTNNFFDFPKVNLFLSATLLAGFFWLLAASTQGKLTFKTNRFLYPLTLLFVAHLLSLLVNFNQIEKLPALWQSLPFLFFPLWLFLLTNLLAKPKIICKIVWLIGATGLSLLAIWLFLTPNITFPLNLNFFGFPLIITNAAVSPTGSLPSLAVFLLCLLPLLAEDLLAFLTEDAQTKSYFWLQVISEALAVLVILTGLGILLFQIFAVNKPANLPTQIGWSIAVETLKNPLRALFGVGPDQFFSAFTQFKPVAINFTPYWSLGFNFSSNEYFQILTTLGLVGLATFIYLISCFLKTHRRGAAFFSLAFIFLSFAFFPANFFTYFLLATCLSLLAKEEIADRKEKSYSISAQWRPWPPVLALIFLLPFFYLLGRQLLAEVFYERAFIANQQNQAIATYNYLNQAITLNPYKSLFHQTASQANLALANSLANQPSNGVLSDQDKLTIAQLIQQAIKEAKDDVLLAPQNAQSWENLAPLYRQLINFAQGADQWAASAYNQVLKLDSNNPQAYLNFGGFFYSLGRFEQASSLFFTATALKPDFANGYYNLAASYKMLKDYQKAYEALNQAGRYLRLESADYQKVQKEIEEVKTHLEKTEKPTTQETVLSLPEPLPTPPSQITPLVLPKPEEATASPSNN